MRSAGIPLAFPWGHQDKDVPTFWLPLQILFPFPEILNSSGQVGEFCGSSAHEKVQPNPIVYVGRRDLGWDG